MSKLLLDENPLMILPQLAIKIGLNEAIVLQQVHYWLLKKQHQRDGRYWVYNTYEKWQENFPFWSVATIKRALTALRKPYIPEEGDQYVKRPPLLIATSKYNAKKYDKTLWYTIDYEALDSIEDPQVKMTHGSKCPDGLGQDDPMDEDNLTPPIPETSTETTSETTEEIPVFPKTPQPAPSRAERGGGAAIPAQEGGDADDGPEVQSASEHIETGGRVGGKGRLTTFQQGDDYLGVSAKCAAKREEAGGAWTAPPPGGGDDALATEAIICLCGGKPPKKGSGTWHDMINTLQSIHADWGLHDREVDEALGIVRAAIALFLEEKQQMAVYKYPSFAANYGHYLSRAMNGDTQEASPRHDPGKFDRATAMTRERLGHGYR